MNTVLNPPLSNVQVELLKIYTNNISNDTLLEMKRVLAKFFLDKARQEADIVWCQKEYSDDFFKHLD